MTDLFQEKAKNWDGNDRSKQLSAGISECILKNVALNDRMSVLDFGAGTGLISAKIAPYVEKIIAVDVSEAMLENLNSKLDLKDKV